MVKVNPILAATQFHVILLLSIAATGLLSGSTANATQVELTLESGSVFRADVPIEHIDWTEVQSNGETRVQRIKTKDIQRLSLCKSPASKQIAVIRKLLDSLKSDQYLKREYAEEQLATPAIGGQFPKMLRAEIKDADAETSYRINRILNSLSNLDKSEPSEFDELILESGRRLRGDAGDFQFEVLVDGQRLRLARRQLRMLRKPDLSSESVDDSTVIQTESVFDPAGKFFLPTQTTIDLETDSFGNELQRKANISDTYLGQGMRLSSDQPGYVGISGYPFKFPGTLTGDNSGNVYLERPGSTPARYRRFRGTLIVDFCVPNQAHVRAGVKEFGLYVARVDHERDLIMEAFNAAGQIIATVEADQRDCVFLGVRSNQLIARVRVGVNPFLGHLSRKVDEDYAFDSICFSTPLRLPSGTSADLGMPSVASVQLSNGHVWAGHRIEPADDGFIAIVNDEFNSEPRFSDQEIQSLTFVNRNPQERPSRRSWSVQLLDGSILKVDHGQTFRSQLVPEFVIPTSQMVALWPTGTEPRLAPSDDWNNAKQVVVLPTGRLLTDDVRFNKNGYSWQTTEKRLQPISVNANESAKAEDPVPDLQEVIYKEVSDTLPPTLWLRPAKTLDPNVGLVQLLDGQRIVFGETQSFRLVKRDRESITLELNGQPIQINNDRIQFLRLENPR